MVDRKRLRRTATASPNASALGDSMTQDQIMAEIKLRSQKGEIHCASFDRRWLMYVVLLQRPGSPSGRMRALSRRLGRASTDLHISAPALEDQKKQTLSRKIQSELNLAQLNRIEARQSVSNSISSGFSGGSGDFLPDEVLPSQDFSDLSIDCDAIFALREVGSQCRKIALRLY